MDAQRNYESKTQAHRKADLFEIAKELISATREKRSFLAKLQDQMHLDDKLLDWTMGNPHLRVQLFRFIDALPALPDNAAIAS